MEPFPQTEPHHVVLKCKRLSKGGQSGWCRLECIHVQIVFNGDGVDESGLTELIKKAMGVLIKNEVFGKRLRVLVCPLYADRVQQVMKVVPVIVQSVGGIVGNVMSKEEVEGILSRQVDRVRKADKRAVSARVEKLTMVEPGSECFLEPSSEEFLGPSSFLEPSSEWPSSEWPSSEM